MQIIGKIYFSSIIKRRSLQLEHAKCILQPGFFHFEYLYYFWGMETMPKNKICISVSIRGICWSLFYRKGFLKIFQETLLGNFVRKTPVKESFTAFPLKAMKSHSHSF